MMCELLVLCPVCFAGRFAGGFLFVCSGLGSGLLLFLSPYSDQTSFSSLTHWHVEHHG
jgi:hypothetical protein